MVIPIQFVLFNLSAILGSAILYGDFRRAKFHQFVTFLYGCGATFAGVWIIAWTPSAPGEGEGEGAAGDAGVGQEGPRRGRREAAVVGRVVPVLRPRPSSLSLVGVSPAQVRRLFLRNALCITRKRSEWYLSLLRAVYSDCCWCGRRRSRRRLRGRTWSVVRRWGRRTRWGGGGGTVLRTGTSGGERS